MHQTTEAPQPKSCQCRHIFADGHQCGSPALRKEVFCYYHHTTRRPPSTFRTRGHYQATYDLTMPEDRTSLQRAVNEVIRLIASSSIDTRRASLLLRALGISARNLISLSHKPETAHPGKPVEDIILDPEFGLLAPQPQPEEEPSTDSNVEPPNTTWRTHETPVQRKAPEDLTIVEQYFWPDPAPPEYRPGGIHYASTKAATEEFRQQQYLREAKASSTKDNTNSEPQSSFALHPFADSSPEKETDTPTSPVPATTEETCIPSSFERGSAPLQKSGIALLAPKRPDRKQAQGVLIPPALRPLQRLSTAL